MSEESESLNEEERSVFRPFTRETLAAIEARIAEENAKKKELQKKKEEGEVSVPFAIYALFAIRHFSIPQSSPFDYICNVESTFQDFISLDFLVEPFFFNIVLKHVALVLVK